MKRFLIYALLACLSAASAMASSTDPQAEQAAHKGLTLFSQILAQHASIDFGSRRPTDVKPEDALRASLELPLAVYFIRLENLLIFTPSQNPMQLLEDAHSFIYPVSIDGKLKSSIRVRQDHNRWHVASIDESPEPIVDTMAAAKTLGDPQSGTLSYFEIPELNVSFVARIQANNIVVAPTYDIPQLGLKGGVPESAQQLFSDLADKLNKMREDSPNQTR